MTDETTAAIRARIAELEKERDTYLAQAQAQIAAFQGGIAELKRLIDTDAALQGDVNTHD